MKKRIVSILAMAITLIVIATAFAACGNKGFAPDELETIKKYVLEEKNYTYFVVYDSKSVLATTYYAHKKYIVEETKVSGKLSYITVYRTDNIVKSESNGQDSIQVYNLYHGSISYTTENTESINAVYDRYVHVEIFNKEWEYDESAKIYRLGDNTLQIKGKQVIVTYEDRTYKFGNFGTTNYEIPESIAERFNPPMLED